MIRTTPLLVALSGCGFLFGGGGDDMTVGADGGRIEVEGAYLDIPAGALSEDVTFSITSQGPSNDGLAVTDVFSFAPHDQTFMMPVELGLDLMGALSGTVWLGTDTVNYSPLMTTPKEGFSTIQVTSLGFAYASVANGAGAPTGAATGTATGTNTGTATGSALPCTDCTVTLQNPEVGCLTAGELNYNLITLFSSCTTTLPQDPGYFFDRDWYVGGMGGNNFTLSNLTLDACLLAMNGVFGTANCPSVAGGTYLGDTVYTTFEWVPVTSNSGKVRVPALGTCLTVDSGGGSLYLDNCQNSTGADTGWWGTTSYNTFVVTQ